MLIEWSSLLIATSFPQIESNAWIDYSISTVAEFFNVWLQINACRISRFFLQFQMIANEKFTCILNILYKYVRKSFSIGFHYPCLTGIQTGKCKHRRYKTNLDSQL